MQPMGYATLDAASPALPYGAHPSLPAGRGEHEYVGSLGGLQSLLEWHPIERKTARSAAQAKSRFRMESRTAACGPSRVVGVSCGTRGSVAELSSDFDVAGRRGGQVILAPFAEEDGASSRPPVTLPSKRYAPDGIADLRGGASSPCARRDRGRFAHARLRGDSRVRAPRLAPTIGARHGRPRDPRSA